MKKNILLFLIICLNTNLVFSQESGYNLDFETGTFVGWVGGTGQCCPINITKSGIVASRHTIMEGKGFDANTCDNIPVVAPGGLYSARLGNSNIGKEAETLSYTLNITEANSLFIYKYAVVLQDPGHKPEEQPYFRVNVYNEQWNLIDPECGSYNVVATSDLPGFESCGNIVYKDWTTVGLDLTPYIGQNITVEFETRDCSLGGHFGYAYVEAYCSSLKINTTYCADANGIYLSAPIGFAYLWETGETTKSIKIDNPVDGQKYICELTSATGCKVDISTVITFQEPIINFEATGTCDNSEVVFVNTTSNIDNSTNSFHWDFGDGTTSALENPTHQFSASGNYDVSFSFTNILGCKFSMTKSIRIIPTPEPHLIDGIVCLDPSGNVTRSFILDTGLADEGFDYQWFLNGKLIVDATKNTYTAIEKGNYSVTATDTRGPCSNQAFAMVTSSQMASNFDAHVSEAFAETGYVNVEVIGGTGPFFFQLDDNAFQESNVFNQLAFGDHTITVKDNVNCTFISKQVSILGCPKFFTPNNDGFNDYWNIPNYKNFFQVQIHIFDRYGKLIKEITPSSLGWDGNYGGNFMPASDYWFIVDFKQLNLNGELESKKIKSHFSLKR